MQSGLRTCKQEKCQLCSITTSNLSTNTLHALIDLAVNTFACIDWSCGKHFTRNRLVVASIVDSVYGCCVITCLNCLFFQVRYSPWWQRVPNRDARTLCCVQYSASSVDSAGERACWCDLHSQHFRRSRESFDTEWLAAVGSRSFCASGGKAEKWRRELGTTRENVWIQFQVHHNNRDSVNTRLPCTTLGSSSAMLTIVMDVKTMTQNVPHDSNFQKYSVKQ